MLGAYLSLLSFFLSFFSLLLLPLFFSISFLFLFLLAMTRLSRGVWGMKFRRVCTLQLSARDSLSPFGGWGDANRDAKPTAKQSDEIDMTDAQRVGT